MDYEKKYKDALERARESLKDGGISQNSIDYIQSIFPELKESGDESIRKALITGLYDCKEADYLGWSDFGGIPIDECVAWLEKQGENKFEQCIQDGDNIVTNEDGTHFNVSQLERVSQKVTDTKETAKKFLKSAGIMNKNGELADEYRLEKQNEQNPTDKFEPKFKVCDWITDGYLYYKITDVLEDRYIVDRKFAKERCAILFKFEHYYHLWTLKDAKDGDVLAFDNDNIVIFKDLYNYTSFHSYCHIEDGIFDFSTDGLPDWWEDEGFKPATKEQSNILFQKMKEAGYEWDADKKELKQIDVELTDFEKSLKHIMIETLECGDTHNLKADAEMLLRIAQKSIKWGEEDYSKVQRICKYLDEAKKYYADITEVRECIDWLKSLEERLKGKNEKVITKEEKDLLLKDLEWCDMETNECHCYNCELFDSKNNVCKCIDLCKRPKSTYKGFYIK